MKRRLKIAALALGLLVLVVLSFLAWVINTEAGLRFAVARLPEKLGKVTLKIEEVHGTITGGFGARMVDVDQELTHVRVEGGKARVNFWPLLVGRISVRARGGGCRAGRSEARGRRTGRRRRPNSCRAS